VTFLFVDDITDITPECIRGRFGLDPSVPFRHPQDDGEEIIAPGVICEAIGQLVSWRLLERNGFTGRPVFLFADRIVHRRNVMVGARLDLEARLHHVDGDSARFSGVASVDGVPVHAVDDCVFSFMPLVELEDPDVCRKRFAMLTNGGGERRSARADAFAWSELHGETLELDPGSFIHRRLRLDPDLDFYADHFPRFPVTPAVILNEAAGQAAMAMMSGREPRGQGLQSIIGCKIRDFVRPGDTVDIKIRRVAAAAEGGGHPVMAQVELFKAERRVMHARWQLAREAGAEGVL
jgi:3-hydroxymyristoyl/3-hydroxydecanoyl-(acyl carrier protein) dehydratase